MTHKAGFVNIIGNPNVGKSTLSNILVGEKLSIITSKAQTTRHRIMGIINEEDIQIILSDTPGILKPNYKLQESMMQFVKVAFKDADIVLYVTDMFDTKTDQETIKRLQNTKIPILLVINKVDLGDENKVNDKINYWNKILPNAEIIPTSALLKFNIEKVYDRIKELLPECPPYFDKDQLTDKPMRFFASEIIREKILLTYKKEIPYSCEVEIEEYIEEPKITRIRAIIYVTRDSQKGIIIGHKGASLKKIGTSARIELENFIGKKVFLEIYVKVNKGWRDNEKQLKKFGYNE